VTPRRVLPRVERSYFPNRSSVPHARGRVGQPAEVIALDEQMRTTQQREITQLNHLLSQLR